MRDPMQAHALTAAGRPASLIDLPDPEAPSGGLGVRTRAASVNGVDPLQADGSPVAMACGKPNLVAG